MRACRPESALSSEGCPPGRTNSPLEREDNVPLPETLGFPAPVAAACMLFILSLIASNVPPIAGVWDFRSPGPGNQSFPSCYKSSRNTRDYQNSNANFGTECHHRITFMVTLIKEKVLPLVKTMCPYLVKLPSHCGQLRTSGATFQRSLLILHQDPYIRIQFRLQSHADHESCLSPYPDPGPCCEVEMKLQAWIV